jgi:hypothetical protein
MNKHSPIKISSDPITSDEKNCLIRQLTETFHHHGELFLRDEELYADTLNTNRINEIIKQFCVWLGVKPNHLKLQISHNYEHPYEFINDKTEYAINLDPCIVSDRFLCVAFIARGCTEYYMYKKGYNHPKSNMVNREIIDLASIQLGFGVIMLNSVDSHLLSSSAVMIMIERLRFRHSRSALGFYTPTEYARLFVDHVSEFSISPTLFSGHLLPAVKKLVPINELSLVSVAPPADFVLAVNLLKKQANKKRTLLQGAIILVLISSGFAYFAIPDPKPTPREIQREKISVLMKAYDVCMTSLQNKIEYSTNDDIFSAGSINSHHNRCQSIKNVHNHEVRNFNSVFLDKSN